VIWGFSGHALFAKTLGRGVKAARRWKKRADTGSGRQHRLAILASMWKLRSLMTTELQFDGCEIVRKLRSGPATNWYLGKQRSLGRTVVIKALSPNVAPESPFAAPLEREAHLLAQLQHKGIVQLYDFVRRPKSMWLVLEFVDGWTLDEVRERVQRFSVPAALAVLLKLLDALESFIATFSPRTSR
jgi:Protein kinase domain